MKKIFSVIIIIALSLSTFSSVFAAANQANDPLNFSHIGNRFIYSNNPENIESEGYTISQKLDAYVNYDAEFYHWNYSGSNMRIGVLICNTNNTSATVKVYNHNASAKTTSSQYGLSVTAQMLANYWNGTGSTTYYTIPANSVKFICYEDVSNANVAAGKVLFKPQSSNLYCKVVAVKTTNISGAISVPKLQNMHDQTTGYFMDDTRYAVYNYNTATHHSFYLNLFKASGNATPNNNEYQNATQLVHGGIYNDLDGNFGITYYLKLKNCVGKTMKITPDWDSIHFYWTSFPQNYTYFDGYTWKTLYFNDSSSRTIPITNENFKFILPGGNTSNVRFEIF